MVSTGTKALMNEIPNLGRNSPTSDALLPLKMDFMLASLIAIKKIPKNPITRNTRLIDKPTTLRKNSADFYRAVRLEASCIRNSSVMAVVS